MGKEATVAEALVSRDEVFEALRTVYDPEIPVNVVDLGPHIRRPGK